MLGQGYHETQEPIANIWPVGTGGFSLHGAAVGHGDEEGTGLPAAAPHTDYHIDGHGRPYADQVNVQWSCGDVTPEGGGFAYIPGSHKAL